MNFLQVTRTKSWFEINFNGLKSRSQTHFAKIYIFKQDQLDLDKKRAIKEYVFILLQWG